MIRLVVVLGALLTAAPLFSQTQAGPKAAPNPTESRAEAGDAERKLEDVWLEFQLNETPEQVVRMMGPPAKIEAVGDFELWRYQIDVADHHEFSHDVTFRISTGKLISVTRTFEPEQTVDQLFPKESTSVQHYPSKEHAEYSARMTRLGSGRLLLAMGSGKTGQPTGKLLLIREDEVPNFVDWVKLSE